MTIEETKALMQKIQVHYWRFYKDMPQEYMPYTIKEWHRFLEKYKADDISAALDRHIDVSPFPPCIAEIKDQLRSELLHKARMQLAEAPALSPPADPLAPEEIEERIRKIKERWGC